MRHAHTIRALAVLMLAAVAARPTLGAGLENLLMPGKVTNAHAKYEADCAQCHDRANRARQAELCTTCHKEVAADIRGHAGFHGRLPGIDGAQCKACHSEHLGRARIRPHGNPGSTESPSGDNQERVPLMRCIRFGLLHTYLALPALLLAAGCGPQATPTYFVPPTMAAESSPPPQSTAEATSPTPQASPVPTLAPPSPTPPCTDGLTYLQDLTIPDGSIVVPGELIDKRWQISNSGTCNWDERYKLTHIGGEAMGAATSLPLYPARAGAEVTISITFTAPQTAGTYESQWQAVNPDGVPFGSAFYMQRGGFTLARGGPCTCKWEVALGKIDEYRRTLRDLEDWRPYLLAKSGLPGPRGNLELAHAAALEIDAGQIDAFLSIPIGKAPENTPEVFLVFCGVLALGRLPRW